MLITQHKASSEQQQPEQESIPMGQNIQSRGHVHEAQKPIQEIGPSSAQTSEDKNNGQTPPTTMETTATHTHVRAEQVAAPTDQPTQSASADQDMLATEGDTPHASQPIDTTTKEIMAVDANQQHSQPESPQATTQRHRDKETQTRIHQTDAAIQTDSLPQA